NTTSCTFSPDELNTFFIDSTKSLTSADTDGLKDKYNDSSNVQDGNTFRFKTVTAHEVENVFRTIRSGATGSDQISLKMLQIVFPHLCDQITHLINFCLTSSVFPLQWKKANIVPVPKKSICDNFSDFRPISILPTLSKVLEKIMYIQLNTFINEKQILPSTQSGFRKHHSTTTALLQVTDDLFRAFDQHKVT